MKQILLKIYYFLGKLLLNPVLKLEQKKLPHPAVNERPAEYAFAFHHLQNLCTGFVLDVGSGQSSWPHMLHVCGYKVTAVDRIEGYWNSFFNRHFLVVSDDITRSKLRRKFQFATCLSVLEHIPDHLAAMKGMHSLLEKNGYLVLSFPYNEKVYHENIYFHPEARVEQYNFITQVYSREQIDLWLKATSFRIVEQEYYRAFTGEMWAFGKRIVPCEKTGKEDRHHLTCILLQKTGD